MMNAISDCQCFDPAMREWAHQDFSNDTAQPQVSKRRVEIERLLTMFVTQRVLFLIYRRSA